MSTATPPMDAPSAPKPRPPAALFALGHAPLPEEITADGAAWRFRRLFKHDFFAATALYERAAPDPDPGTPSARLAVLKVQRTHPFFGLPMQWLGTWVARREIRIYRTLQGVPGIPAFLGTLGPTGFLHAFIPGADLHDQLPLTSEFFDQLQKLLADLHARRVAYVDSNKRENILHGDDGRPWLIDFQISYDLRGGWRDNFPARWLFRRFVRADWYHFYKHKTRLLPAACALEDFAKARHRGFLHRLHRFCSRPIILVRRKILARYDLVNTR